VEFVLAGLGLVIAIWMIYSARDRHRSDTKQQDDRHK
jgi:hypothetical protein